MALAALAATALVALPLAAGFFGRLHPALDSFSHFRVYLCILLLIVALPLLVTRFLKLGALAAGFAIVALATTSGTVPIPSVGMAYGRFMRQRPKSRSIRCCSSICVSTIPRRSARFR